MIELNNLYVGFGGEEHITKGKFIGGNKIICLGPSIYDGGLGFRNIRSFIEAFLAKQFWRLHTEPITMLAK